MQRLPAMRTRAVAPMARTLLHKRTNATMPFRLPDERNEPNVRTQAQLEY